MEKIVEQSLLYDFYSELLNEHQRRIYEDAVFNDLSLGEIAQEQGISRQGVHDILKRCSRTLQTYEEKLQMMQRFLKLKEDVEQIQELAKTAAEQKDCIELREIRKISKRMIEEL